MMHVKQITNLIQDGKASEAEGALEQLLALGPKNVEALKLKSTILSSQGRFDEELEIWTRILKTDNEDQDAIHWLQERHLEEQEHRYFSDHVAGGGYHYLTYQRGLLRPMVFGLIGSLSFTFFTNAAVTQAPRLASSEIIITSFFFIVFLPLVFVIKAYLTTMHALHLDSSGICVSTRLKSYKYKWEELADICLSFETSANKSDLALSLIPKDPARSALEIDLNPDETSIRSRHHLIENITSTFKKPSPRPRSTLEGLKNRKTKRF
jgi:tetratricopeptide (TPR) repeat protein